MALTGRAALAALVAALVLLALPGWTTFALANAAVIGLVGLDLAFAGGVRALVISRSGATRARVGEPVDVVLVVTNTGGRTARLVVRDAWPPSAGAMPRTHRILLPPRQRRRATTTLVPSRRGDCRPARLAVRSLGPLGLAGRQGRHEAPWAVRVLPPFGSRRFLPERLSRLRVVEGQVAARGAGQGSEFDTLRPYVAGDDARAIDWRATARRGSLEVRSYRPERDRQVILCLDTGRTSAARVEDAPRLDHALDAAVLLAALASRAGDRVDLVAFDALLRTYVRGGPSAGLVARLVEAMALLQPVLVEPDPGVLVTTVLTRVRQRALLVLFTDLNSAALEEGLLPVLGALTARHTVVIAAVGDPAIDAMAGLRGAATGVYAAAAAEKSRTQRRRMATELRRRGVETVEAPAGRFAPAVADAYLSLKAAGRL